MEKEIVISIESTDLSTRHGGRLLAIAALNVKTMQTFYHVFKQEKLISETASMITGISNDMIQKMPVFEDKVEEFLEFICGAKLIFHNAPFDMEFINYELGVSKSTSLEKLEDICNVVDVLEIAKLRFHNQCVSISCLLERFHTEPINEHSYLINEVFNIKQVYGALTRETLTGLN